MSIADPGVVASNPRGPVPFTIRIAPWVVNSICTRLKKRRSGKVETSGIVGLLFGTVAEGLAHIQVFRAFPADARIENGALERDRLDSVFEASRREYRMDSELAGVQLLGWCSIHEKAAGTLRDTEFYFHNRHFRQPADLALIVKPQRDRQVVFQLYARSSRVPLSSENHRMASVEIAADTFVMEPLELTMSAPARNDSGTSGPQIVRFTEWTEGPKGLTPIKQGDRSLPSLKHMKDRERRLPWLSSLIVFLLAACGTVSFFYVKGIQSGTETTSSRLLRAILPRGGLELHVEDQGDRLLVRWNRRSLMARSATGGLLQIDDGSQHRDVPLDSEQVADGAVLYRPGSGDVTFRLTIHGAQGATVSESMRVLDGSRQDNALNAPQSDSPATGPLSTAEAERRELGSFDPTTAAVPAQRFKLREMAAGNTGEAAGRTGPISDNGKSAEIYVPPRPLKQVLPNTALLGPGTIDRPMEVEVYVLIDETGRVTDVHLMKNGEKLAEALTGSAMAAAKQWVFEPATLRGKPVASEHTIVFQFSPPSE